MGFGVILLIVAIAISFIKEDMKEPTMKVFVVGGLGEQGKGCIEYLWNNYRKPLSIRTITRDINQLIFCTRFTKRVEHW